MKHEPSTKVSEHESAAIARMYGRGENTIKIIVRGKTWKHLLNAPSVTKETRE